MACAVQPLAFVAITAHESYIIRPVSLRSQIISDVDEWSRHRVTINDLLSTCSLATAQSSTTWLTSWWQAFGAGNELRIGLFWSGSTLVGYAPLMISREPFLGIGYRVLRFVGDGISDYADLFSRDDHADVKQQMVQTILRDWQWDELNLINVRGGSNTLSAFESHRTRRYFVRVRVDERCPYIDLRGLSFERYYRSLSRNHRRELQKRKHKLDAIGGWTLEFAPTNSVGALFDEFQRLHRARCDAMGWSSVYDMPGFREHFASLLGQSSADLEVLCSTLRHGTVLMSYTLGFVMNRIYYHWNIGFDEAYEAIAPNKLHHQFLIQECIRRGYHEFDFMRGGYEYKFKWTDTARDNYALRILKRHGLRRPVNHVRWLKEREAGSFADRCIIAARTIAGVLRTARTPNDIAKQQAEPVEEQPSRAIAS